MDLQIAPAIERRIGPYLSVVFGAAAILGGMILVLLVLMTMTSITGRTLFSSPVTGDFELVEMGTAVAVFLMLPHVQFVRGHVAVEVFTSRAPWRVRAFLALFANVVMLAVAAFITWRTQVALGDRIDSGEVSYLLSIPRWLPYLGATIGCYLWTISSFYTVWRAFNELAQPKGIEAGGYS